MNKKLLFIGRSILSILVITNVYYEAGPITAIAIATIVVCLEYDFGQRKKLIKHVDDLSSHVGKYLENQATFKDEALQMIQEIKAMIDKR